MLSTTVLLLRPDQQRPFPGGEAPFTARAGPGGHSAGVFKGLESDVVVLVGIDLRCMRHPANLYVGASRGAGGAVCVGVG